MVLNAYDTKGFRSTFRFCFVSLPWRFNFISVSPLSFFRATKNRFQTTLALFRFAVCLISVAISRLFSVSLRSISSLFRLYKSFVSVSSFYFRPFLRSFSVSFRLGASFFNETERNLYMKRFVSVYNTVSRTCHCKGPRDFRYKSCSF